MKITKAILLSNVCLLGCMDNFCYAAYPAWDVSSRVSTSGIHTYHTLHHPTDGTLFLPHPQAQSGNRQRHPWKHSRSDIRVASVCFITDVGNCSGEKFSNDETPGNGNGNPGSIPDYDTQQEQCQAAGYGVTSCPAGSHPDNPCPADSTYYQKCVCDANITETCTKPYYGVGPQCEGKYASCELDNQRACKEDGYTNTCSDGQKLRADNRCPYDNSFGICCTESCPANSSTTCTGADDGSDGCGYICKKCCSTSCPAGYDYTESQLTGASGSGWVKDGNDYCDHCTRGKLYKRKAATCPSSSNQTCGCGGSNPCKSGNNTYYSSCNCCSNCSGSTSNSGMKYYNSCYNSCTGQTLYTERACDNSCTYYSAPSSCADGYTSYTNECGTTCYRCKTCSCKNSVAPYCINSTSTDECGNTCYSGGAWKRYNYTYWYGECYYWSKHRTWTMPQKYDIIEENADGKIRTIEKKEFDSTGFYSSKEGCEEIKRKTLGTKSFVRCT